MGKNKRAKKIRNSKQKSSEIESTASTQTLESSSERKKPPSDKVSIANRGFKDVYNKYLHESEIKSKQGKQDKDVNPYLNAQIHQIRQLKDFEKYSELKHLLTDCKACSLKFSSTNKPKVLFCSHTVCEYCIVRKIQKSSTYCPLCRAENKIEISPSGNLIINNKYEKLFVSDEEK